MSARSSGLCACQVTLFVAPSRSSCSALLVASSAFVSKNSRTGASFKYRFEAMSSAVARRLNVAAVGGAPVSPSPMR